MYNFGHAKNLALYNELINEQYSGVPKLDGVSAVAKTDAPMLSSTTGFLNAVYGASVFQQLQSRSVLFNALPKFPHKSSGFRARTTRFIDSGAGVSENGAIPNSIKPTLAQIDVPTKENSIAFELSQRQLDLMATGDDTAFQDVMQIVEAAKEDFIYAIDRDLNQDVTTEASSNMESIDRVVSSYAEVTNCSDVDAGDSDIYGIDRDAAASWADAYVGHNSGTARTLSRTLVQDLIENTVSNGADPRSQIIYTGADTASALEEIFDTQIRYDGDSTTAQGLGDRNNGANFGAQVGRIMGRPVFVAPSDTVTANGDISNLYCLDIGNDTATGLPILGIKTLKAPMVAQTGLNQGYPAHGKLGNEYVMYMSAELECRNFKRQGKLRDLKA